VLFTHFPFIGEYVIGKVGLFQDQLNVLIQEHTWQNHGLLNVPLTLYHSILCVSDNVIYLYNVIYLLKFYISLAYHFHRSSRNSLTEEERTLTVSRGHLTLIA